MLIVLALEVKASFQELSLLFLELIPLIQELSMQLSTSILRCCCSHLNFRSPSKIVLLEAKPCVSHFCLHMRLHIPQMGGETGLLLLRKVVEVLFCLQGEFCSKGSRNLLQLSPLMFSLGGSVESLLLLIDEPSQIQLRAFQPWDLG